MGGFIHISASGPQTDYLQILTLLRCEHLQMWTTTMNMIEKWTLSHVNLSEMWITPNVNTREMWTPPYRNTLRYDVININEMETLTVYTYEK